MFVSIGFGKSQPCAIRNLDFNTRPELAAGGQGVEFRKHRRDATFRLCRINDWFDVDITTHAFQANANVGVNAEFARQADRNAVAAAKRLGVVISAHHCLGTHAYIRVGT